MTREKGAGQRPQPARIDVSKYRPMANVVRAQAGFIALNDGDSADKADKDKPKVFSDNPLQQPGGHDDFDPTMYDKPPKRNRLLEILKNLTFKQRLIIAACVFLLTAGSAAAFGMLHKAEPQPVKQTAVAKPKPKPAPPAKPTSPLTGIEVSADNAKRPVVGVMIENSIFARPQSGLDQAGVVYEAIAEYGITRYLALYQEANPGNIGPIRSARPYYVDWAHSYDASYAHVGGSPDGLAKIKADGIRDMDQFFNSGSYHRISQREAPHNVYTSMQALRDLTAAKGWGASTFTAWPRKKDAPADKATANKIDINISGPTYSVHYDYDKPSNSYLRVLAGEPHTDNETHKQLQPKVVVALATQYNLMSDGYHSMYTTTGSGALKVFQDGTVTEGTWKRDGNETYKFYDSSNNAIKLNAGQTWITVVGNIADATFTPAPAPAP